MLYSFRKLSITSTASEFNLIILNPRNEYNTPSKPSGTNGLLEQPLAMGSERRSAPRSAATAPACKGFPVTQRREHLWRPGALNGINAPHNHPMECSTATRQKAGSGVLLVTRSGGVIHAWSWFPNLRAFLR
jgi:hypothetical protein